MHSPALKRTLFPPNRLLAKIGVLPQRHDGQNTCRFSETRVKPVLQKYIPFRNKEVMI
jgi:hypothetical protein